jgi:hypothetical protein
MAITGWRGISGLRGIIGLASLRMRAMLCWRRLRTWSGRGLGPPNFKSGLVWVAREAALDQLDPIGPGADISRGEFSQRSKPLT